MTVIAERAAHPIDWQRVDVDTLRTLRLCAVAGRERPLADYLAERFDGRPSVALEVSADQLGPDPQFIVNERNFPPIGNEMRPAHRGNSGNGRSYLPTPWQGRGPHHGNDR